MSEIETELVIDRHKTAISRYNFSKPVQSILEYNLLEETESFFDYGCGLGDDLRGLSAKMVDLRKYLLPSLKMNLIGMG